MLNSNIDRKYSWLLFFFSPFVAFVLALKNIRAPYVKNIMWAFFTYYGFAFVIGSESQHSDINGYISEYQQLHNVSMSIGDAIMYFQLSGEIDVLRTLIAIILSRFTDAPVMLLLVYAGIFGYFYSRNIVFVVKLLPNKLDFISKLVFACLFLILPIWFMNGFRMWTAMHIFIFGLLRYFFENKKNAIWILVSSVFVHFSFVVPLFVFILYLVFGNKTKIYFGFFIITIVFNTIELKSFNQIIETYAPVSFAERSSSYRDEGNVEELRSVSTKGNSRWYAIWYNKLLKWAMFLIVILAFNRLQSVLKKNQVWYSLFSFILLFFGIANILSSLPSGGRFLKIPIFLTLTLILLLLNAGKLDKRIVSVLRVMSPIFVLFIIVSIRIGLYSISAMTILGNPFLNLFMLGDQISINDLIK